MAWFHLNPILPPGGDVIKLNKYSKNAFTKVKISFADGKIIIIIKIIMNIMIYNVMAVVRAFYANQNAFPKTKVSQ